MTIIVDDNGRGLPVEEHGRCSAGSPAEARAAPGGSGLGLALVAQQAELHDGTIELSDGPLGGLRATLTVSTAAREPDDRHGPRQPSSSAGSPARRRLRS